jgi:hypothetical protein
MKIKRCRRNWAVYDERGALVCVCVYRKGAREVVRRLLWLRTMAQYGRLR